MCVSVSVWLSVCLLCLLCVSDSLCHWVCVRCVLFCVTCVSVCVCVLLLFGLSVVHDVLSI